MTDHNTRAAQMWEYISPTVDFRGRTVLDAGCGYGDFVIRSALAGASLVMGVDHSAVIAHEANERIKASEITSKAIVVHGDLNRWNKRWPGNFDIVICFSVLPYLRDFHATLERIRYSANDLALIEVQTFGDGPGLAFIKNDQDMRCALDRAGFAHIEAIGATSIKDRGKMRTIWRCEV